VAFSCASQIVRLLAYAKVLSFQGELSLLLGVLPYMFLFWIFSIIAGQWSVIGNEKVVEDLYFRQYTQRCMYPIVISTNILAMLVFLFTFIVFLNDPDEMLAILGAAVLGFISFLTAVIFLYYSLALSKRLKKLDCELDKPVLKKSVSCCRCLYTVRTRQRIQYFGIVVSLCFALQAICHIGSIFIVIFVDDSLYLFPWIVSYQIFNILSLIAVLMMFIPGISSIQSSSKFKKNCSNLSNVEMSA